MQPAAADGLGEPARHDDCKLLSGWVAGSAQAILALIVVLSLLYKRHREKPQRPLLIWGMDVSKQIVSSGAAHMCGILVAMIAQSHTTATGTSQCSWYFVVFTLDTSLGVALTLALHRLCVEYAKKQQVSQPLMQPFAPSALLSAPIVSATSFWDDIAACGQYGNPPSVRKWAIQLGEFTLCVALARVCCGFLVLSLDTLLSHVAQGLDALFVGRPALLLFAVMVCCPLGMNMAQAFIQDQFLKWRKAAGQAGELVLETIVEEGVQLTADDAPKRSKSRKAVGGGTSSSRPSSSNSDASFDTLTLVTCARSPTDTSPRLL